MKKISTQDQRNILRKNRVKAKIQRGGITRPRFCVSKTNKHIFLQIIDDIKGVTLVSASDKDVKGKDKKKIDIASELGKIIAAKAIEKKIKKVVFDRNKYNYHGIVKLIADGAREGGLEF
ncbi:MAG TPA: 50S ribosomal protein L18 [Patescibacteria group bacterium]|nr:50S ribosomal protein L18 [Patescibacteria group bacterium]